MTTATKYIVALLFTAAIIHIAYLHDEKRLRKHMSLFGLPEWYVNISVVLYRFIAPLVLVAALLGLVMVLSSK
jgi:TRAP-type C4-dicarboxylate transport system permease small subunit